MPIIQTPVKGTNMLRRDCLQSATISSLMHLASHKNSYHMSTTRIRKEMNISLLLFIITLLINQVRFSLGFRTTISPSLHHKQIPPYFICKSKAFLLPSSNPNSRNGFHFSKGVISTKYVHHLTYHHRTITIKPLYLSDQLDGLDGGDSDSNKWISSDATGDNDDDDWEQSLENQENGSLWSSFESSGDDADVESSDEDSSETTTPPEYDDDGETFLDAIAAITADEIEFMNTEADRADKARQMQEWGFSSESISSTLGVAIDESLETDEGDEVLVKFQEETAESGFGMYLEEEVDLETVESHTTVAVDEETGYPTRSQMVFVDEHTCIGCYNCAMVSFSLDLEWMCMRAYAVCI